MFRLRLTSGRLLVRGTSWGMGAAVLLGLVGGAVGGARSALAQGNLTPQVLIGDAVTEPDHARYADIREAIKRYANEDPLGARKFLETATAKEPKLPPVDLMMAKMYFLSGQTAAGMASLEATVQAAPADPEPYLLLADQAVSQQRAIHARALYDKAIALLGEYDDNLRRKRLFEVRARAGRSAVYQRWKWWDQAEADLRAWLEVDPEEANAYSRLGVVLFMQNRERDGYEAFKKAYQLDNSLAVPYLAVASMYQQLGKTTEAETAYTRAYDKYSDDHRTVISYGEWLVKTGNLERAVQVIEAGIRQHPTVPQLYLLQGIVAHMQANAEQAEAAYQQVLALDPGNRDAHNQLALLLIESADESDRARAEQLARLNSQLNPNNADVNITLAWVMRQRGNGAEANQAYQKGLRLGSLNADSTLLVAKLLVEQNRREVARNLLQNAIDKDRGIFVQREEAQALLQTLP